MKFTVQKENLLSIISNACEITNNIPKTDVSRFSLRNVLLELKGNLLNITGTDYNIIIKNNIEVQGEEDGRICVMGKLFLDLVSTFQNGSEIVCEVSNKDNSFYIKSGKTKLKLITMNPDEFPIFEEKEFVNSFKINVGEFIRIIDKTSFSMSNDQTQFYLNGLFLHSEDDINTITGVTLDGQSKLTIVNTNQCENTKKIDGFIIPKRALQEIKKILLKQETEDDIEIFYTSDKLKLVAKGLSLINNLINADYPNYKEVIPNDNNNKLECLKDSLVNSISKVAPIVEDSHKIIEFEISKNLLKISANSIENGSASDEIEIESNIESPIKIGFNSKSMKDILSQIKTSEYVTISIKDNYSVVIIKGKNIDTETFILGPSSIIE